jgi:hypothetical protein
LIVVFHGARRGLADLLEIHNPGFDHFVTHALLKLLLFLQFQELIEVLGLEFLQILFVDLQWVGCLREVEI